MINIYFIGKLLLQALTNQAWGVRIPYPGQSGVQEHHYNGAAEQLEADKFPKQAFLAFSTTTPSVNSSGVVSNFTEPTGGNYERQELTKMGPGNSRILADPDVVQRKVGIYANVSDATPSEVITKYVARTKNTNEIILFPHTGSSAYSAAITHFGIFDAETGGNLILFGELTAPVTVGANVVPVILKDGLEITLG